MRQIRRIDDLRRIVIPREIREFIMAHEGIAFDINVIGKDSVLTTKVKEKEKLKDNIVYIKRHLKDPDIKKEINSKSDDICKIIDFSLKK